MMSANRLPTVFLPHGAGPCFFMEWEPADTWQGMEAWLRNLLPSLNVAPRALLVISAHWGRTGVYPEYSGRPRPVV